ncbi:PREDICTED: fatty acyl-CoA reductase 1 [Nicrophorus vespilloides]|uniref:Fatty acyl-CoA reductase n=1 Tax=Nicrophorus vespilloides TaxID=110193 RepID=A0ABM1MY81_NICVS|nr:PREDICTED: fatty acyl-CoA reductase 1 [Nicrophorus vespilloides]
MADDFGIPEYFADKNVFVTGATGFMGKVLIEKILRCCPNVNKIYILLRPKRDLNLQERLDAMYKIKLFDKLNELYPDAMKSKIIPIAGDVVQLGLGISAEDRELLKRNVNIIYHAAASVRFDQPLNEAIIMNTRGTLEACKLALEMKNLELFMHVSTAYCHTSLTRKVIEEKIYPPYADWRKSIEIAENMDPHTLQILSNLYMSGFPNTYTFTKSLAENVVYDLLNNVVPNIILRPSIVTSAEKDPLPGWIDNFNGPVGIFLACGTGIVRINYVTDAVADYVSVDAAINGILMGTWYKTKNEPEEINNTTVYNCGSNGVVSVSLHEQSTIAHGLVWDNPLSNSLWYPSKSETSNITIYYILVMLLHFLPAIVLDGLLKLFNKKPMILKIHRKIYSAVMALKYFIENEWTIVNDKLLELETVILPKDKEMFGYNVENFNIHLYFENAFNGAKQYLLKEKAEDLPAAKKKIQILYFMDVFLKYASYGLLIYIIYKCNVLSCTSKWISDYFEAL